MDYPETDDEIFKFETEEDSSVPIRRGLNKTAWLVIIVAVGFITYFQNDGGEHRHPLEGDETAPQDVIMLLQCRYLVAAAEAFEMHAGQFYEQASLLNQGSVEQRLRFVIVAEEMVNAEEALKLLEDLDVRLDRNGLRLTDKQTQLREAVGAVMADYAQEAWDAPSINKEQKELLKDELGWFGRLALAPKQSGETAARKGVMWAAQRTLVSILGAMGLFVVLLLAGCLALVLMLGFSVFGNVKRSFIAGNLPHAGVYAETFAVWICLFMLLNYVATEFAGPGHLMLALSIAMFGSLSALFWPQWRGVPWSEVRRDIGWTGGRNPMGEILLGGGCYAMTIPILFIGFLLSLVLMLMSGLIEGPVGPADEFAPTGLPSHPIVGIVSQANWTVYVQLFLAVAVAAPVVEETMFRGVLYRNLREMSARWGFIFSFLFSAAINSFIFAVIHPQGYVAVPALMAIALGLTLAREWRGTLIPSMVAHGIHNGLLMTVLILAVGE